MANDSTTSDAASRTEAVLEALSRRDVVATLLGASGIAALVVGCNQSTDPSSGESAQVGVVSETLTGTTVGWVDTVLGPGGTDGGAPDGGATRTGDLATKNSSAIGSAILVAAKGCVSAGDGGGGLFYWESGITTGDDGGTIIVPSPSPTGRWRRIYSGALDVRWFGVTTGDGVANNSAALMAVATVAGTAGTILIPKGITCASSSQTISAALQIDNGGLLMPMTGQTLTLTGPQIGGVWQRYTNALSTQGTISFSGNKVLVEVWPEYWGGGAGVLAATNAKALNAANAALMSNTVGGYATGTIRLGPGNYDIDATVNLGSDSQPFTAISLEGTAGSIGSLLRWTGTTNGTAIYCTYARYSRLQDFAITSTVARGTSIGLRLSGPSIGTNNSGVMISRIGVTGFNKGVVIGDGAGGGHDASEVTLIGCLFTQNDTGLETDGYNSLNIILYACAFDSNANIGLDMGPGGAVRVFGGTWGRHPYGIYVRGEGAVLVSGVRDEPQAGGVFLYSAAANITADITIVGCDFTADPGNATIQGLGSFTLMGNCFGSTAHPVIPFLGNSSSGNGASLTMIGNEVNEAAVLFQSTGNSVGMTYNVFNNTKTRANPGGADGKWDDEEGIIDNNANRIVTRRVTGLYSARTQTLGCVGLISQNSGAALTVSGNAIAPTSAIHQVGAGLIKTITVPSGFSGGSIDLVPTAAFTYDATGNIVGSGTAVIGRTMRATYNSVSNRWSMSY